MVWTMPEYEVGGTASDPATRTWYGVYWDYQTGLVRMTNIFKSCKYRGLNKKVISSIQVEHALTSLDNAKESIGEEPRLGTHRH